MFQGACISRCRWPAALAGLSHGTHQDAKVVRTASGWVGADGSRHALPDADAGLQQTRGADWWRSCGRQAD